VARAGAGPTRDLGKHFFFFLFCLFCLQRSEEGDGNCHRLLFPLMELRCSALQ
jgi:hypothetical protein